MKRILIFFLVGLFFTVFIKPVEAKRIALTFDADMTPLMLSRIKSGKVKSYYNDQIATFIVKNEIPSTIFLTGLFTETYKNKLQVLANNSFIEFENHSYDHNSFEPKCFGLKVTKDKTMEIKKTNEIINNIIGRKPTWFRFPGGCHNQTDDNLVAGLKMKVASWTIVSGDAFSQNFKGIVRQVLSKATDGDIVVMHFGSVNAPATAKALPLVVDGLKKQGFELVTLNQL